MPQAPPFAIAASASTISLRRLGIDTYQEPVLYMHRDCHVCHSEGFEAQSRVEVTLGGHHIVATLNVVSGVFLSPDEAGLSEAAWRLLGAREGDIATLRHPAPLESLGHVRAKVYGRRLTAAALEAVIADVAAGHFSDLQLAAFVTACAGDGLDLQETISLTRAMVNVGERMTWGEGMVMDKHSRRRLAGQPNHHVDRADRRRLRAAHAQDLVARHHLAGGHRRHHGDAGAGRPRRGPDPARGRAHRRLRRSGAARFASARPTTS